MDLNAQIDDIDDIALLKTLLRQIIANPHMLAPSDYLAELEELHFQDLQAIDAMKVEATILRENASLSDTKLKACILEREFLKADLACALENEIKAKERRRCERENEKLRNKEIIQIKPITIQSSISLIDSIKDNEISEKALRKELEQLKRNVESLRVSLAVSDKEIISLNESHDHEVAN